METLNGPFKDIIPNFQKHKKSLGYKYDNIYSFCRIDKILYENEIYDFSDSKKIYELLVTNEQNTSTKKRNYMALKTLYQYMELNDYKNLYFETISFSNTSDFRATILTKKQILKFFLELDNQCKNLPKDKCYIYPVLFRLVYSNGLRISEALNLTMDNISFENKVIYIQGSKENISREIPLSESMVETLNKYKQIVPISKQKYLFELNNKKLLRYQVNKVFQLVLKNLDFSFRIHDFRGTFAVTTFNNLFDKGYKNGWILYYLHFYMGHKSWKSTEQYLQYTSERYKKVIKEFTKKYPDLYPKIGGHHE